MPNITGTFAGMWFGAPTGAFTTISEPGGSARDGGGRYRNYGLDASRSSSVYGSSTTVTPLSESCFFCIKF